MARLIRFFSSSTPTTVPTRQRRLSFSFSSWASSSRRPWCCSAPAARTPSCGGRAKAAPVVKAADGGGAVACSRKHMLVASLSGIGGKAARMVSWNRRSPAPSSSDDDEEAAVEDEDAMWRKAIIMGEKCRPLEFSGHIAFDSDGNQLPPSPAKKAASEVTQN